MQALTETPGHIFLTGNAGTGKTTMINEFVAANAGRVIVLAPTGIAAVNCGGMTIHRFFKFPARPINYKAVKKLNAQDPNDRELIELINAAEYFIIDEISMVRADIMDQIGWFFHKNFPGPALGGKKFIMVGDLNQLPPVVATDEEREMLAHRYRSEFFFDATIWGGAATFSTVTLTKIWRQSDPYFISILNKIKGGTITPGELDELNAHCLRTGTFQPEDGVMLCATNAIADEVNTYMLNTLPGVAVDLPGEVLGEFNHKNCTVEKDLRLKVGARVMTMRNDVAGGYCNGTIGTVTEIETFAITIKLDNDDIISVGLFTFEEVEYKFDKQKNQISHRARGKFIQFPLRVAYAITIHKSQGKTFDKVIIDLGARGAFAHGQVYVALSRARTLEGVILRRPIAMKDLIYNSHVTEFNNYERT